MSQDKRKFNEDDRVPPPPKDLPVLGRIDPQVGAQYPPNTNVYPYPPYYHPSQPYYNQPMYSAPEEFNNYGQPKSQDPLTRRPSGIMGYAEQNPKMMPSQGYQMIPPPITPGSQVIHGPPNPGPASASATAPPPHTSGTHMLATNLPGMIGTQPIGLSNQTPSSLSNTSNSPLRETGGNIATDESQKKKHKTAASKMASQSQTRKRALTACNTCRVKKVKCDNIRPRCGSCVKNGIDQCEYNNEDQIKDMNYDPSAVHILLKLDTILLDLQILKAGQGTENVDKPSTPASTNTVSLSPPLGIWDMSFTSIMRWPYFSSKVTDLLDDYSGMQRKLMSCYSATDFGNYQVSSSDDQLANFTSIEAVLSNSLGQSINAFFLNCHTKIPVVDVLNFLESIEMYKLLHKTIPGFSLMKLAEDYFHTKREGKIISDLYLQAISTAGVQDVFFRRNAYSHLCKKLYLIPIISALGVISSSIQLDNFAKYKTSIEERSDLSASCLTEESISLTPLSTLKERLSIASSFVTYAKMIVDFWPGFHKPGSTASVLYNLFLSQFNLYIMKPAEAYRYINLACQSMMYNLEKRRDVNDQIVYKTEAKQRRMERLFWICLKLECELRAEMSPKVPKSGITEVEPPCNFPTIPDPVINEVGTGNHSEDCVQIATKFDDQYTWYFFLTEIAVRKVDNNLYNEFYSVEATKSKLWDQPQFFRETFWVSFIRYLNQYNGIINSLSPSIRNFVLKEVDIYQIFQSVSKSYEKRKANDFSNQLLSQDLDDFLIDEDLLIQAKSESIMYIKTRILTSKMLLFRPIVYLILEDRIPIQDLLEGALAVFAEAEQAANEANSNSSSSSFDVSSQSDHQVAMDYEKLLDAPLYYQKSNVHEDFSRYFSNEDGKSDDSYFKINQLDMAKKQVIRLFFVHLRATPKLNLPKLAGHRHPGQWYYLRNLLTGNFYMFLLYKKLQDMLERVKVDPNFRTLFDSNPFIQSIGNLADILDTLLPKDIIVSTFKHALLVYEYWKDESADCVIYAQLVQKCIDNLE